MTADEHRMLKEKELPLRCALTTCDAALQEAVGCMDTSVDTKSQP